MIKRRAQITAGAVVAVVLYGGSLYALAANTARIHRRAEQQAQLAAEQTQLQSKIKQEQQQISYDKKAIAQLKASMKTVKSHTTAIQHHTTLLNQALGMLHSGASLDKVIALVQSGNVPVSIPKVPAVTVQQATVSSSPPAVNTVSRSSAP